MKYMERRGSGLKKIIMETEKLPGYMQQLKPEFSSIHQVTHQDDTKQTVTEQVLVFCMTPKSKKELQCLLPPYPYFRALYAVPVRQVRGLLTASFRFRLTADTLAVRLCASSLPMRTRDFHPLELAHAGQTEKRL